MAQPIPSYLLAADSHNILGSGTSWLNPSDWGTKADNIYSMGKASILSGWNSFYNTGAIVGSWLGAETDQRDTQNYISSIDSDLGRYYRDNKESADLIGFIGSSIIPGLIGVKALHLGQTALKTAANNGVVGGNMAKALGVLVPKTENYVKLAAADINASTNAVKLFNANTYKAIASGFWQNTLEAAAFETVVQATLSPSPVLDQQDGYDILKNVLIGGALGGAVGGAFTTARIRSNIKANVKAESIARAPFEQRPSFGEGIQPHQKIVSLAEDMDVQFSWVPLKNAQGEVINNLQVAKNVYESKVSRSLDEIRTNINSISETPLLGNIIANMSTPIKGEFGYASSYMENFFGALEIVFPSTITKAERKFSEQLIAGEVPKVIPSARYLKVIGEGVGTVTDSQPTVLSLGDIYAGRDAVWAAVKTEGFSFKNLWDATKLSGRDAHLEAEKRYIWAKYFVPKIDDGTLIHRNDIPLLERALNDRQYNIKIVSGEGASLKVFTPTTHKDLYDLIKESKIASAAALLAKPYIRDGEQIALGAERAAKISNIRQSYLEGGMQSSDETLDLFAQTSDHATYLKSLKDRKLSTDIKKAAEADDPLFLPKHAKIVYDSALGTTPQTVFDALVFFKSQEKLYSEGSKRVVAKIFGAASESLPDIPRRVMEKVTRVEEGAELASSANSGLGTFGSIAAWLGSFTNGMKTSRRSELGKNLESSLVSLRNKPEAAIEFEGWNQKASRSGKLWVQLSDPDYGNYMVTKNALKAATGPEGLDFQVLLAEYSDDIVAITNPETLAAIRAHISETGSRTTAFTEIRGQQGHMNNYDPAVYRPIRPDLKQYPHYLFVIDDRVTGSGHTTLIHAATEKELNALRDRVPTEYTVKSKGEISDYYKARGEFDYSRALNENYIDASLKNEGIFSNFFPKSDPTKIVDDLLQQHYRESDLLVYETMRLRYEPEFSFLEDLGKQYSRAETSQFASSIATIEKTSSNPYFNLIKTALDISKAPENHLIYGFNKSLDEAVSKAVSSIKETFFARVKTQADLDIINSQLDKYGIKPAYYDSALQAFANHTAPRGELTKFVREGNSLLSLFTLGLDWLNALNNAIGSNILRGTETVHITKAIAKGDTELAGAWAELAKIKLPGVDAHVLSPAKLQSRAYAAYFKEARDGPLFTEYLASGIIKSREDQLKLLIDDFTLQGTETVAELSARSSSAYQRTKAWLQKGERYTLNAQAEEMNRFVSAHVADQINSVAIKYGLMDAATAKAYRNTFVNRVEGTIIASQRPLVFQGPIGQAIGLFQSYQFNLMQQLFRYVGEGSAKDIAMLAGLQSTMYGIQSLPGFQAINTHIVGQLSGNKEHRDTYDAVYGTVGRTAGDFILYGLPSNLIPGGGANIYSRGDINPRQLTILPTSLQEIPIVAGWGKFLGSLYETTKNVAGGANIWESILQGVEHNGISRPLAGFAQTLQGIPSGTAYSTSSKGSILYSNDLLSLASLTRLAGGRPMDEAVLNDTLFRVKAYETAKRGQMQSLAERVKSTLIQGNLPTEEQVNTFAERYVSVGGKQSGFNKWMMELHKNANVAQSTQLAANLQNPFAYKMQLLMGGDDE